MMKLSAKAYAGILRTLFTQMGATRMGEGRGTISFFEAPRPESPDAVVRQEPLATVPISRDSAVVDDDGADCLCLEGKIHRRGKASWARITNDGKAIMDLDVGKRGSTAEICMSTVEFVAEVINLGR
jgi:hypothetical protein